MNFIVNSECRIYKYNRIRPNDKAKKPDMAEDNKEIQTTIKICIITIMEISITNPHRLDCYCS